MTKNSKNKKENKLHSLPRCLMYYTNDEFETNNHEA